MRLKESNSDLIYLQQCGDNRIIQFNEIGIYSLRDILEANPNDVKKMPGVYDWHVKRWKLQAKILLNNEVILLDKPPSEQNFFYYDIETDTQQSIVWLIGVYDPIKKDFIQFFTKDPEEEKDILFQFHDYLEKNSCNNLCSYSASWFDRRVIQKRSEANNVECEYFRSLKEIDLGLEVQKSLIAKVPDYQLRTIGDFFGYPWKFKHDIDGFYVGLTFEQYLKDTSMKVEWDDFLNYNKDDVLSIPYIIKKMNEIY